MGDASSMGVGPEELRGTAARRDFSPASGYAASLLQQGTTAPIEALQVLPMIEDGS